MLSAPRCSRTTSERTWIPGFEWAQRHRPGLVERTEDLILVIGCTLVTSWAAVAFAGPAEISMGIQPLRSGGEKIICSKIEGSMTVHTSHFDPNPAQDQCVFIRGFQARRIMPLSRPRAWLRGHPRPDDNDNDHSRGLIGNALPSAAVS